MVVLITGNLNGPPPVPPRDSAFDPGIPIVNKQPQQQHQNGNKRGRYAKILHSDIKFLQLGEK